MIEAMIAGETNPAKLVDLAPKHRRPARRDGPHHASLDAPEMTGARLVEPAPIRTARLD